VTGKTGQQHGREAAAQDGDPAAHAAPRWQGIGPEAALAAQQRAWLLHDGEAVEAALRRLAVAISADLAERHPVVLCVMLGGLIPCGRLLPMLDFPLDLDYLHATRYRGDTAGGVLHWLARPRCPLTDRDVLIVDDILDEGRTLEAIIAECRALGARSVRVAVLVRKRHQRCVPGLLADYVGLEVDDHYVFGEGMDYHEGLRNLRGIHAIDEDGHGT